MLIKFFFFFLYIYTENCSTYHLTGIRDCYPAYSFAQEEKSPHCLQWKQTFPCELQDVYNETLVAWSYTQVNQIDELPIIGIYNTYGGGGYVINFQVRHSSLFDGRVARSEFLNAFPAEQEIIQSQFLR